MSAQSEKTQTSPQFINPWRRFIGAFVPNWLMMRSEVSPQAKLLYGRLAQYAGQKGVAWPRQDTLAAQLGGLSDRTIRRHVKELKEHGLIYVLPRDNKNFPNKYKFLDHPWMHEGEVIDDDVPITPEGQGALPDKPVRQKPGSTGQPCPVGQDRTVLSRRESWKESHQKEENHVADDAPRRRRRAKKPPPGPPAPKAFRDPGPLGSDRESAAAGEEEEESATFALDKEKTRPLDVRMEEARKAAEPAKAKADKEREKRMKRKLARDAKRLNFEGEAPKGFTKEFERLWRELLQERLPGYELAAWGSKERGQLKQLVEKYNGKIIADALRYVVENWEAIRSRIFRGRAGHPTIGMILKLHDTLVVESQTWAKNIEVIKEYEAWSKANPHRRAPKDLKTRYRKAKAEVEAIGSKED